MIKSLMLCLAFFLPQASAKAGVWDSWSFLIGDWVGEGAGPGQGSGGFSFHFDLQGKVLVRKNRAEYPATKDRPAFVHEDINYTATLSADQNSMVFLSDSSPPLRDTD